MENSYHYRHFLICNKLANRMNGHKDLNFAQLVVDEENGRFMNSQMTKYFYMADRTISELIGNDEWFMFEELDINEVAKLSVEEIEEDYFKYCNGVLKISSVQEGAV